ncbi:MAG TPA: hypothetical protein VFR11_03930 [Micromonosporaceae bacterium]|nr:hypothetical protein [Micromonosporaceae bacterium]
MNLPGRRSGGNAFDRLRGRPGRQPAFGIVGTPDPIEPPRTIDPVRYGLPPREDIRTDIDGPDPTGDAAVAAVRRGDWRSASEILAGSGADWERRTRLVGRLGAVAKRDDAWLTEWLASEPDDPAAHTVTANALAAIAWAIRTSAPGQNVSDEQWRGFFRVMRQAPEHCRRAAALAPSDPTPWIELLIIARGLQYEQDQFRTVWQEVRSRAPDHLGAHLFARIYWQPEWFGSTELHEAFIADATHGRPMGSLFTLVRLCSVHDGEPRSEAERPAYYREVALNLVIDEAAADLAAASPDHPYAATQRHMLAYLLTNAGRHTEAYAQFKAIGAYCGSSPWWSYADPLDSFVSTRSAAVMGWEDAGRPTLP